MAIAATNGMPARDLFAGKIVAVHRYDDPEQVGVHDFTYANPGVRMMSGPDFWAHMRPMFDGGWDGTAWSFLTKEERRTIIDQIAPVEWKTEMRRENELGAGICDCRNCGRFAVYAFDEKELLKRRCRILGDKFVTASFDTDDGKRYTLVTRKGSSVLIDERTGWLTHGWDAEVDRFDFRFRMRGPLGGYDTAPVVEVRIIEN